MHPEQGKALCMLQQTSSPLGQTCSLIKMNVVLPQSEGVHTDNRGKLNEEETQSENTSWSVPREHPSYAIQEYCSVIRSDKYFFVH